MLHPCVYGGRRNHTRVVEVYFESLFLCRSATVDYFLLELALLFFNMCFIRGGGVRGCCVLINVYGTLVLIWIALIYLLLGAQNVLLLCLVTCAFFPFICAHCQGTFSAF